MARWWTFFSVALTLQIMIRKCCMPKKIFMAVVFSCVGSAAIAQGSLLLEACNALNDSAKRLQCLQELMRGRVETPPSDATRGLTELRRAFTSVQGAVDTGISLAQYRTISLDPAKALATFRSENPAAQAGGVEYLLKAATAYRDAQEVWQAAIFKSQDAGIFGRILNWRNTGLEDIVNRYSLSTTTVLLNDHLPADVAIKKIWQIAAEASNAGFELLTKPSSMSTKKEGEALNHIPQRDGRTID